jgi:hypothetical protein
LEPSRAGEEDGVGTGAPGGGLGVFVVLVDITEGALFEPATREFGEGAFDPVERAIVGRTIDPTAKAAAVRRRKIRS